MKVKVYGAGSIGNHLSNAARTLGWSVDVCDIDPVALKRMQTEIYPCRYGAWDEGIQLFEVGQEPKGGYDLIIIGTPPDAHLKVANAILEEKPRAVLLEKPLCEPAMGGLGTFLEGLEKYNIKGFVGYDHVVGKAAQSVANIIKGGKLGAIDTIDVEFREFWGGIFAAHPWLDGPKDSYLGFWQRGGGASGEHSHALNLWQFFAHEAGLGTVSDVSAELDIVSDGTIDYDKLCVANLRTSEGLLGRVVQDVVTSPPRKWARIQAENGFVEWQCGFKPGVDRVVLQLEGQEAEIEDIEKTRPDDFIQELRFIEAAMNGANNNKALDIERGVETMQVIAAIHESHQSGKRIQLNGNAGSNGSHLRSVI